MISKKSILFFILCSFTFFSGLSISVIAQKVDSTQVDRILGRMQSLLSSNSPTPDKVNLIMSTMKPDGSWQGIDYRNTSVHWSASRHLSEFVLPMAEAYADQSSSFYKNKALAQAVLKGLDFWLDHNFTSQNWWYNDIGVPNLLTNIMILMNREISQNELLRALNQMRGSYIDQTGQNKVWRAEIQLKIGLLEYGKGRTNILGSPEKRIQQAVDVLKQEVVVTGGEGIQPDGSFHQHGVQQQFGNYGLSFAATQVKWAWILKGSAHQYSPNQIAILRNYILNGLSKVVWRGVMDISGVGRQIFLNSISKKGESVIHILQLMAKVDPEYASEYQQTASFNLNEGTQPFFQKGNSYFWRSDLMVNRSENSYVSVRMCSGKIQSTESGNGENLLGSHLSDGATYLYKTGEEYENIFPVWDWHRIPGVTSYTKLALPPLSWQGLHNENDFVGGVSDSIYGIASMLFKRNGLTARKSWFFIPGGFVCLGAGIHSDKNTNVATTINQTLLKGKITVNANRKEEIIKEGSHLNKEDINWVFHDHTGYLFLQRENIYVGADRQKGAWKRIYAAGNPDLVERKIFNLWIDHGAAPQNRSYAYMVFPKTTIEALNNYDRHLPLKILKNDSTIQAIQTQDKSLTQIVFYRAGKIDLDKKITLQANAPCMLMMQQLISGLKLTISAPPEMGKDIILFLNGRYKGEKCTYDADKHRTQITFDLPDGIYAGKSVNRIIK